MSIFNNMRRVILRNWGSIYKIPFAIFKFFPITRTSCFGFYSKITINIIFSNSKKVGSCSIKCDFWTCGTCLMSGCYRILVSLCFMKLLIKFLWGSSNDIIVLIGAISYNCQPITFTFSFTYFPLINDFSMNSTFNFIFWPIFRWKHSMRLLNYFHKMIFI